MEFIAEHWVSWAIEVAIMSVVAWYTITETRQTARETREEVHAVAQDLRELLGRLERGVSARAGAVDEAARSTRDAIREGFDSLDMDRITEAAQRALAGPASREDESDA